MMIRIVLGISRRTRVIVRADGWLYTAFAACLFFLLLFRPSVFIAYIQHRHHHHHRAAASTFELIFIRPRQQQQREVAIISFFNSNNFVDKDPGGGGGEGGFPKSFSIKRDRERTKAELLLGGLNDAQLSLSLCCITDDPSRRNDARRPLWHLTGKRKREWKSHLSDLWLLS